MYPIDTINTRMKANKTENVKFLRFARETFRREGVLPLYRGGSTAIYISFIPSTIYFTIYESLTKIMKEKLDRSASMRNYKLAFPILISGIS
jgi:hypothetical protein